MAHNPFYLKALPGAADVPFCNRTNEIAALTRMAESKNDVVIYAPRRYGKTSLVRRVQRGLASNGAVTVFVDFSGVASVNEVATRLATAVYEVTHGNETLWKKAIRIISSFRPVIRPSMDGDGIEITAEMAAGRTGFELLEAIMKDLHSFVDESKKLVNVALDEFQEIVVLPDAAKIEAIMRTHIQKYQASHFFIGSRRRVLRNMFNEEQRPFFRSAVNFNLNALPGDELVEFVTELFEKGGKVFSKEVAKAMVRFTQCHPHYTMKLGLHVFELAEHEVSSDDVYKGMSALLADDRMFFESMVQALPPQQRLLLRALAKEPAGKLLAREFVKKHDLGSATAISNSAKRLQELDYIEEDEDRIWRVVDPIFAFWLRVGEKSKLKVVSQEFSS